MILALDAMGGDNAPQAVVDGALLALRALENDFVIWLFGDETQIRTCLQGKEYPSDRLVIKPSTEIITCEEAPAVAVRRKKNASMVLAAKAVADKEADCFISAGSTGAVERIILLIGKKPERSQVYPAVRIDECLDRIVCLS